MFMFAYLHAIYMGNTETNKSPWYLQQISQ
jgi:hypothetical protein